MPEAHDSSGYHDFEVTIDKGLDQNYPVSVVRSIGGEAHDTFHLPFDQNTLERYLRDLDYAVSTSGRRTRQSLSNRDQKILEFGRTLFNSLLNNDIRSLYYEAVQEAEKQDKGLRFKLKINAPDLFSLPWEFMYDQRRKEFVCLSSTTPVVRYIEQSAVIKPLTITPPLRILAMIASPSDEAPLDVNREKELLQMTVRPLEEKGLVTIEWLDGQGWRDLQEALWRDRWHVFHFIGHGEYDQIIDEGVVILANEQGLSHRVKASNLARLLADHRSLRLVVLNTCEGARGGNLDIFSSTASILVQRGIPAVLGMQYEVTDEAAIELTRTFYNALAQGKPIDTAITEARKAIVFAIDNTLEWATPVLFMRAPNGVLFELNNNQEQRDPPVSKVAKNRQTLNEAEIPKLPEETLTTDYISVPSTDVSNPKISSNRKETFGPSGPKSVGPFKENPESQGGKKNGFYFWKYLPILILIFILLSALIIILLKPVWDGNPTSTPAATVSQTVATAARSSQAVAVASTMAVNFTPTVSGSEDINITFDAHSGANVQFVSLSPRGNQLLTASHDSTVKMWNINGNQVKFYPPALKADNLWVNTAVFSPDGSMFATGGSDGNVKLWDAKTLTKLSNPLIPAGKNPAVSNVVFSPDGRLVAAAVTNLEPGQPSTNGVVVWDVATGQERYRFSAPGNDKLEVVTFSPDNLWIASGYHSGEIDIWSLNNNPSNPRVLKGHTDFIWGLSFSRDGKFLASASTDKTVKLWNISLPNTPPPETLSGHTESVDQVRFSKNGKFLVSGSTDGTIRIWDLTSQPYKQFGWNLGEFQFGQVISLDLSQDDRKVIAGYAGGKVRIWDLSRMINGTPLS